jgi:hypothetical protein
VVIYHSFNTGDVIKLRNFTLLAANYRWLVLSIEQHSEIYRLVPWNPIAKKWADSWLPDTIKSVDEKCILDLDMEEAPW